MQNSKNFIFIIAIAVVIVGAIGLFGLNKTDSSKQANVSETLENSNMKQEAGLTIEEIEIGNGPEVKCGNIVTAHYTGRLEDGTQFDSSFDRGTPFQFRICQGQVIPGWDQGLLGMKVGEKRKLTVPPELAYGENEIGPIPPNSTLIFDIELVNVEEFEETPTQE